MGLGLSEDPAGSWHGVPAVDVPVDTGWPINTAAKLPWQAVWLPVSRNSGLSSPGSITAGIRSGVSGYCHPYVVRELTKFSLGSRGSGPGRLGLLGSVGIPRQLVATFGATFQPSFRVLALAHSFVSLSPVSRFVGLG